MSDGKTMELTSIFLITNNPKLTREVQQALDRESDFLMVTSLSQPEKLAGFIQVAQPGIILLDYEWGEENSTLALIDELASRYLNVAIVAIIPDKEIQRSDRVILAGARAILHYPFDKETLMTTLRRVRELLFRNLGLSQTVPLVQAPAKPDRCFVVYSPKGGVGCTTVAINLAIALHQQLKQKVLLIDGRHILGHVALMLNLRTGNSITDLLSHVEKLDEALISQVVVEHVSGIAVLTSPMSFERGKDIRPEDLYKVVQALKAIYPIIVVDGGSFLDDNLVTYMDMADAILMVINPNLASLRDARQFLNFSRTLSYPQEKILLVLNQAGHKADVKMGDIEKVLHTRVLGTIPVDEDLMLSCLNEGVPVIVKKPGHAISKAYKTLAASVIHALAAVSPIAGKQDLSSEALRKSSYLG